ncbi:MAG TPA: hypothetical protein VJS44_09845 [Pyrinomonadaceae bacterium]|nr:hypothetical protein [Pyrinomonadaceae bacterium]
MRVMNNNPLDLQGANQETITVTVDSSGTENLVSYTLDGNSASLPTGVSHSSFNFKLDRQRRDPSLLTMLFTFSGSADGRYDITVRGSGGGDVSDFSVGQFFAIPGNSITYTIDVMD